MFSLVFPTYGGLLPYLKKMRVRFVSVNRRLSILYVPCDFAGDQSWVYRLTTSHPKSTGIGSSFLNEGKRY